MSRGVNRVTIIGNVGKDPEIRYTPSGTAIASISVATSETWKDKQTGEVKERTEWHRIEAFGKLAEIIGEYLKKGSQVYIEGKLRTDEYEKDGIKRYATKIIADQMHMLGSKSDDRSRPQTKPVKDCPQPERDEFEDSEIPFREVEHDNH